MVWYRRPQVMNRLSTEFLRTHALLIFLSALLVIALAAPVFFGYYFVSLLRDALALSILAIGLDLMWGKTNILSFGHAAFFGAGAYGVAIVSTRFGLDVAYAAWVGLLSGIAIAILVSFIVGYFLIYGGVRGAYFTIVTLALAVITDHIVVGWSGVTGGNAGLLGIPPLYFPSLSGMSPLSPDGTYWFVLVVVSAVLASVWLWCRGHFGLVLRSICDNEKRASALGYDTSWHLLVVFVISAAITALGGGIYAAAVGFVAPDIVGLLLSTQAIVWVAIGGRGTLIGPVIATIFVIWMEQEISSIDTKLWPLAIGCLFILAVFVFPNGIVAKVQDLFAGSRIVTSRNSK